MELSLKEKILIGVIGITLVVAMGSSIWTLVAGVEADDPTETVNSSQQEIPTDSDTHDKQQMSDEESISAESSNDTANDLSPNSTGRSTTSTTSTPTAQPSTSQGSSQQPSSSSTHESTQSQPEVATCNESMKASYTSLRDAKIAAENTRWGNQQDSIRSAALGRGVGAAFSGIPQGEIDAARPAHQANLAAIESEYQQNLLMINCL